MLLSSYSLWWWWWGVGGGGCILEVSDRKSFWRRMRRESKVWREHTGKKAGMRVRCWHSVWKAEIFGGEEKRWRGELYSSGNNLVQHHSGLSNRSIDINFIISRQLGHFFPPFWNKWEKEKKKWVHDISRIEIDTCTGVN